MLLKAQYDRINRSMVDEIRRFIDDPAFARRMAHHPFHGNIGDWIDLAVGRRVLELGVGPGRYAALLQTLGFDVVGVDPIHFETWKPIRSAGKSEFFSGVKAEKLPFQAGEFDHVVCMAALHYFDNPRIALKEARRVLKPGGRLIVRTANRRNLYTLSTGRPLDPAARNYYTVEEMTSLLNDEGFEIHRQFSWGFWPPFLHMQWWYAVNVLPLGLLTLLADLTPPSIRHNHVTFARRTE